MRSLVLLFFALFGTPASACGVYDRATEQRIADDQKHYLSYADLRLVGTWKVLPLPTGASDLVVVSGTVPPDRKQDNSPVQVSFVQEINCGFPAFPEDGQHGTFYLRAVGISPGDYLADDVSYDLLHFKKDRKRH